MQERPKNLGQNSEPLRAPDRTKIVEEIFKRFHKELIARCQSSLRSYQSSGRFISNDIKHDAEDRVAEVYKSLLTSGSQIDLSRDVSETRGYLHNALNYNVDAYIRRVAAAKRIPKSHLLSFDASNEENFSSRLQQYFVWEGDQTKSLEREEQYSEISEAVNALEVRNKKQADIIRKRYQEGKSDEDIAKEYNNNISNITAMRYRAEQFIKKQVAFQRRTKGDFSVINESEEVKE